MTTPDTAKLWATYTSKLFLTRADIVDTFGVSASTAARMIRKAREAQRGLQQFSERTVRTREAYEAWGIDPDELKKRAKEIQR